MDNLKVNITLASLSEMEPIDTNKYQIFAAFFKPDGSGPLDNINIPNRWAEDITTTTTAFSLNIPIQDRNYNLAAQLRIYADSEGSCCLKIINLNILNRKNPTFSIGSVQPTCVDGEIVNGTMTIKDHEDATRYLICYDTEEFSCAADCATSSGTLTPGVDKTFEIQAAAAGGTRSFVIRLFNGAGCDAFSDFFYSHKSPDCSSGGGEGPVVSNQAVVMSSLNDGKIYRYEPSTGLSSELFTAFQSNDVAHTATKLFLYTFNFVSGSTVLKIREFNIVLNGFTYELVRDYELPFGNYGAGFCAVSNTRLYMAGKKLVRIDIVGTAATAIDVFSLPENYNCTGDMIYDATTNLCLMSYNKVGTGSPDYRIGIFQANGTIVRSAAAPTQDIYGMYQYLGVTYLISGSGQVYSLNLTTLVATLADNLALNVSGASQIPSQISIPG